MRIQHVCNQNHHQQYTLVSYFLFDLMIEPRGSKEEVVGYEKASPKWLLVLGGTEEGTQKSATRASFFSFHAKLLSELGVFGDDPPHCCYLLSSPDEASRDSS